MDRRTGSAVTGDLLSFVSPSPGPPHRDVSAPKSPNRFQTAFRSLSNRSPCNMVGLSGGIRIVQFIGSGKWETIKGVVVIS